MRTLPSRGARIPDGCSLEAFYALPGAGGSFVLLARAPREAYRLGLRLLPAGRRRWRLARGLLDAASRAGIARVPGCAQVGLLRRSGGPAAQPVAAELGGPVAAVSRGVPGLHQKLTVCLAPSGDLPARIVKISLGAASERQVEHEARALESLAPARRAPRLLASGRARGRSYLVQEMLDGRRPGNDITPAHIDFLSDLARTAPAHRPFEALESFAADTGYLERRADPHGRAWSSSMRALAGGLTQALRGSVVPHGLAHGDFTPANLSEAGGRILAFDWEYADPVVPALHDLFHFVTRTGVLARRESPRAILDRTARLFAGPAASLLNRDTGGPGREWDPWASFGLYVLHTAVQTERRHEIERPRHEQVEWLRSAHIGLARLLAERLCRRTSGKASAAAAEVAA